MILSAVRVGRGEGWWMEAGVRERHGGMADWGWARDRIEDCVRGHPGSAHSLRTGQVRLQEAGTG